MSRPTFGVVVPCRNEARVLRRKLGNLAQVEWPPSVEPHRVVVVDDGSDDGTGELARELGRELFDERTDVRCDVFANDREPGKAGAISCGIDALGAEVGVVALTDADVVLEREALLHLAQAFDDAALDMASGAQVFVRDLADDGTPRSAAGGVPEDRASFFDRATRCVRLFESRLGKLFSVHGQLLAWRASLELRPSPGVAADDLDLVLAVRSRGGTCRFVDRARFLEVKSPPDPRGRSQALRRARAYFQAVEREGLTLGDGFADRVQWSFYSNVPRLAPELLAAVAVLLVLGAGLALGLAGAGWTAGVLAFAAITPLGREALSLARVIAAARSGEELASLSDRWEMERS